METKVEGEGAEENWTPVKKKKKNLRDRRVSMNSDEGVRREYSYLDLIVPS